MTITKTSICNNALIALGELVVSDIDTDTSKRATTLTAIYEQKLKYLLRKHEWKFAAKRVTLEVAEYYIDVDAISANFVLNEEISGAVGSGTIIYIIQEGTTARYYLKDVTTGFVDDEALSGDASGAATANGVEVAATPVYEYSYMFPVPSDFVALREVYPTYLDYKLEGNFILCGESSTLQIKYTRYISDPDEYDPMFSEALSALLARESAIVITDSLRKQNKMDELFEDKVSDAMFHGSIEDPPEQIEADDWLTQRY